MKRSVLSIKEEDTRNRLEILKLIYSFVKRLGNDENLEIKASCQLSPNEELKPFYALIYALLSLKTSEALKRKIMNRLIEHFKVLTPQKLAEAKEEEINDLVEGCFASDRKTKYIMKCSQIIHEEYKDKVPNTLEELTKLPGIGMYYANLISYSAFSKILIPNIDSRNILMMQRIGWLDDKVKEEEALKFVKKWLPEDQWEEFSISVYIFCKSICSLKEPHCDLCPLAENSVCKDYCTKNGKVLLSLPIKNKDKKAKTVDIEELGDIVPSEEEEETEFLSNLDLIELANEKKLNQ